MARGRIKQNLVNSPLDEKISPKGEILIFYLKKRTMTRLTIDLPEPLHKTLQSLSVIDGKTMENIAIAALETYAQSRANKQTDNYIDENEADELLKPVFIQYATQIQEGSFEGESWEEVKKQISQE